MMIAKMIGISRCTGFRMMIYLDTMIVIGRIGIDRMIIDKMFTTMITDGKMTIKMSTRGIVVMVTIVTIHHTKKQMIVILTEEIDIMLIEGPTTRG